MISCYDYNCEEYMNEAGIDNAIELFTDRKLEKVEEKYRTIRDFLAILYYFWFVEEYEISQIAEMMDENVSYVYATINFLQWGFSHDYDENARLAADENQKMKEVYAEAIDAVKNYDFEKHKLYCKATRTDYFENMLKKTYRSIGFDDKYSYLKFMFYLIRVRKEALTNGEIGKILNISDSAVSKRARELGIALSKEEALANMVSRGRKDMSEILRKGRKTTLRYKEGTTSSISENRFRLLISESISNYFDERYEVIVGVNTFAIFGDLEIDIPIIVIDLLSGKIYRFCVEYSGVFYHDENKDSLKAERAVEKGWYYIPVYEGKGGIGSNITALLKEAERVCKAVCEIVTEGATTEIFDIIRKKNEVIENYVKPKNERNEEFFKTETFARYESDEIKLEIIRIVRYYNHYKVGVLLTNSYKKSMKILLKNLSVFGKRIPEFEEKYSIEENVKKIVTFRLEDEDVKGLQIQKKEYLSLKFEYTFSDDEEDILEERECAQTSYYDDADAVKIMSTNGYYTRDDIVLNSNGLIISFLGAKVFNERLFFLCLANNESVENKRINFDYLECEGILYRASCNDEIMPGVKKVILVNVYDTEFISIVNQSVTFIARNSIFSFDAQQYDFDKIERVELFDSQYVPDINFEKVLGNNLEVIETAPSFIVEERTYGIKYLGIEDRRGAWAANFQLKYELYCAYLKNVVECDVYINGMHFLREKSEIKGRLIQSFDITLYEEKLYTYGVKGDGECVVEMDFKIYNKGKEAPYCEKKLLHIFSMNL